MYRISHSQFLGGPAGWTQEDRDKAIWHEIHKSKTCKSCGTHPDDWDPKRGGRIDAWVADDHHCMGCQRLEQAREQAEKRAEKGEKPLKGTTIVLRRPEPKPDRSREG